MGRIEPTRSHAILEAEMEGLAVGRVVHITHTEYDYSTGERVEKKVCRAAMVTEVHNKESGRITVTAFLPSGTIDGFASVPGAVDGYWHWPERA